MTFPVSASAGRLILIMVDGTAQCIDVETGDLCWSVNCGGQLSSMSTTLPATSSPNKFANGGTSAGVKSRVHRPRVITPTSANPMRSPLPSDSRGGSEHGDADTSTSLISAPTTPTAGSAGAATSVVSPLFSGFGSSAEHVFAQQGLLLRQSDEFLAEPVRLAGQFSILNSSESQYMELRLSDGEVICQDITDGPLDGIPPPREPGEFDEVTLALVRHNAVNKGKVRGVQASWRFVKGDILVNDVSPTTFEGSARWTPAATNDSTSAMHTPLLSLEHAGPHRDPLSMLNVIEDPTTVSTTVGFEASGRTNSQSNTVLPLLDVRVNGLVTVRDSFGEELWEQEHDVPIVKAYLYSNLFLGGHSKLREVPVRITDDTFEPAVFFDREYKMVFTTGNIPPVINISGLSSWRKIISMSEMGIVPMIEYHKMGNSKSALAAVCADSERGGLRTIGSAPSASHRGTSIYHPPSFVEEIEGSNSSTTLTPNTVGSQQSASFSTVRVEELGSSAPTQPTSTLTSNTVGSDRFQLSGESQAPAPSFLHTMFEPLRTLGKGAAGKVILCRHKMTGTLYAIKMVVTRNAIDEADVVREVNLHEHLLHDNIVRYHSSWNQPMTEELKSLLYSDRWEVPEEESESDADSADTDNLSDLEPSTEEDRRKSVSAHRVESLHLGGDDLSSDDDEDMDDCSTNLSSEECESNTKVTFIQLEYCTQTLADWMMRRRKISREDNLLIACQLCAGVMKLHEANIIHRDIKPTNVFIDEETMVVKLGDFGLAKFGGKVVPDAPVGFFGSTETHTIGVGSPLYSSPEQLEGKSCTSQVDVFAIGILIGELYILPSTASERHHTILQMRDGRLFDQKWTRDEFPEMLNVVARMVTKDPAARISLKSAKKMLKAIAQKI